jgi:hypothetical protein
VKRIVKRNQKQRKKKIRKRMKGTNCKMGNKKKKVKAGEKERRVK